MITILRQKQRLIETDETSIIRLNKAKNIMKKEKSHRYTQTRENERERHNDLDQEEQANKLGKKCYGQTQTKHKLNREKTQ